MEDLNKKKEISIETLEKELANYLFMSCSYGALVSGKMSLSIAEEQAKEIAPLMYEFVQQAVKDTAEKFAERLKGALFDLGNVVTEKDIDEICKEFTEGL